MFGKLVKNELKAGLYTIVGMYGAVLAMVAIMMVAYAFDITWISALSSVVLMITSFAILLVTGILIVSNFYKSLYGSQGYLSFTLPVTGNKLLGSKVLVASFWFILSFASAFGIWVFLLTYLQNMLGEETLSLIEMLFGTVTGLEWSVIVTTIFLWIAKLVISMALIVMTIFFSITLSNTRPFQKSSVIFSFIFFFISTAVLQGISTSLTQFVDLSIAISTDGVAFARESMAATGTFIGNIGITGSIFDIVVMVAMFFVTSYLMNKKINIK